MGIHVTRPLVAWNALEHTPVLKTLRAFLEVIPNLRLLAGLRAARAKGCDDDPVRVLWETLLVTIALRYPSVESCRAERRRNEGLRHRLDIDTEDQVPKSWNMSKFPQVLRRNRIATKRCGCSTS